MTKRPYRDRCQAFAAGASSGIWVYRVAAGLLVALGTLTALTGARTPVVWAAVAQGQATMSTGRDPG
jgi:hypothetical protein